MPITLESRVRQMQVFNLPHDVYCKNGCACSETVMVFLTENPRTGDRALGRAVRKVSGSLTLLARERRGGLPNVLLEVPEVKAAIARGRVRLVEQASEEPSAPSAGVPAVKPGRSIAGSAPAKEKEK